MRKSDSSKNDSTEHIVGRTPWDVASQALRLLGILGPLIILASFGFYAILTFQQSLHRQNEEFKDRLSASTDRLIKTYDTMEKVSASQVDQLSKLFHLTGKVSTEAREAEKSAKVEIDKATAELKIIQNELAKEKAELAKTKVDLSRSGTFLTDQDKELEGIKTDVAELAKFVREKELGKAAKKLNELLRRTGSQIDLPFDAKALSGVEEQKIPLEPIQGPGTTGARIRTFSFSSKKNQAAVEDWLKKNNVDMPIAFFLRSPNRELQQKIVRELGIP
jgi:hypothetical protein